MLASSTSFPHGIISSPSPASSDFLLSNYSLRGLRSGDFFLFSVVTTEITPRARPFRLTRFRFDCARRRRTPPRGGAGMGRHAGRTCIQLVPRVGVEPTNLAVVDFESTASANSATWAFPETTTLENTHRRVHVKLSLGFEHPNPPSVFICISYLFFLENS